jgi:glycosidase
MTLPGAPCIYYGDEVGMEGGKDPDCRRAFPWRRSLWHKPTWNFFRKAVALRRSRPVLRRGDFRPVHGSGGVLAFLRRDAAESLLVILNAGKKKATSVLALPGRKDLPGIAGLGPAAVEVWQPRAARAEIRRENGGAWSVSVELEPRSARVLRLGK